LLFEPASIRSFILLIRCLAQKAVGTLPPEGPKTYRRGRMRPGRPGQSLPVALMARGGG
jgi:hypothetical protein